jgi:hypothetical protein
LRTYLRFSQRHNECHLEKLYRKRRENSRFWKQGIIIAKIKGYGKKKYIPERYLSVSLLTLFYKRFGSVGNVPILE